MTREEAIKIFREWIDVGFPYDGGYGIEESTDDEKEALDMAIQALSQEPCDDATLKDIFCMGCEYKEQEPCDDAISREAVINLIRRCNFALEEPRIFDVHNAGVKFEQYVTELPSVTQKSGKWIPVSERLPEDGTWNLFTDGKCVSVERYKSDAMDHFYPSGRWFSLDEAIAWMPLPKPYEPQESED